MQHLEGEVQRLLDKANVLEAARLAAEQLAEDKNAELENNSSEPLNLAPSKDLCQCYVTKCTIMCHGCRNLTHAYLFCAVQQ